MSYEDNAVKNAAAGPSAGAVLTWFRLQEPFFQKGSPRLFSDDAVYGQILILLVVLDRRFRGRTKLAIFDQDWEAPPLVEHKLQMFNYRWAALRAGANLQHWEAKGNLNVRHLTAPYSRDGRYCIELCRAITMHL